MTSNPNLDFQPHVSSGGQMAIGGSVGTGNVGQSGTSSSTGASVNVGLDLKMGGMGMGGSSLMNLQNVRVIPVVRL
eukprot:CAMPEP_0170489050 /NCGR_PEP_ID=MMETSP0208-20121228/7459_1 /TAXON_ID=197538 /ORGANISM="Strombidium inclinatum, Strain S3" /LENGTH=75 /DNA_ID=CAMNT_0010763809 /DNA_START=81 /DNA_END=308 /DNA_ORIENTATION=+